MTHDHRSNQGGTLLTGSAPLMTAARQQFDAKWTPEPNTGCWLWIGRTDRKGYGRFSARGIKPAWAHRAAWEFYRGPIPHRMQLDHVCRVHSCVNPDHLRIVTLVQNVLENSNSASALNKKKTHCPRGHSYTGENVSVQMGSRGTLFRRCRACDRELHKAKYVPRNT